MKKIMVTGACGQIGSELVSYLQDRYGQSNIVATDIKHLEKKEFEGIFEQVDVKNKEEIFEIAKKYKVDTLIHLASILSVVGEKEPVATWELNTLGLINALEVARTLDLKFFTPSSIASFGSESPKINTPNITAQNPITMYGITKLVSERLCDYYYEKYGLDTRCARLPGIISYKTLPGGGTTDYAVDIYYKAIQEKKFTSPIASNTNLDMIYMPDLIESLIFLLEVNQDKLVHRNSYNISSMSVNPQKICASIQKFIPQFKINYNIDPNIQEIAESWPDSIDSTISRKEWGFNPKFNLDRMTQDMLENIRIKV